jgi:hypothetical protein
MMATVFVATVFVGMVVSFFGVMKQQVSHQKKQIACDNHMHARARNNQVADEVQEVSITSKAKRVSLSLSLSLHLHTRQRCIYIYIYIYLYIYIYISDKTRGSSRTNGTRGRSGTNGTRGSSGTNGTEGSRANSLALTRTH